jgi:hypothetical protein
MMSDFREEMAAMGKGSPCSTNSYVFSTRLEVHFSKCKSCCAFSYLRKVSRVNFSMYGNASTTTLTSHGRLTTSPVQ